ncbi:MAG: hypothetical protein BMS9Abin20_1524 [Acidimicrobiia bacterium]|nr:MAG: hypothetical protein BMS9Abin20_1524 [Acidimicrobiia bacterium]
MAVVVENTPNPRAMKFTVGTPVGGPATFTDPATADERVAAVLNMPGVVSVFMTGDFVTVTRGEAESWDSIIPGVVAILESSFS